MMLNVNKAPFKGFTLRENKLIHPVYAVLLMRKLGKKAYRKRRNLSAVANSIFAGNPELPFSRASQRNVLTTEFPHSFPFAVTVSGIKPSRVRIISTLVAVVQTGRLIIRRAAGGRSLSVTRWQNMRQHRGRLRCFCYDLSGTIDAVIKCERSDFLC